MTITTNNTSSTIELIRFACICTPHCCVACYFDDFNFVLYCCAVCFPAGSLTWHSPAFFLLHCVLLHFFLSRFVFWHCHVYIISNTMICRISSVVCTVSHNPSGYTFSLPCWNDSICPRWLSFLAPPVKLKLYKAVHHLTLQCSTVDLMDASFQARNCINLFMFWNSPASYFFKNYSRVLCGGSLIQPMVLPAQYRMVNGYDILYFILIDCSCAL